MRRILSLVVLLFFVAVSLVQADPEPDLFKLYSLTGAELQETEFQAWLLLDQQFDQIPVEELLAEILTQFGYQVKGSIQTSSFQENFVQAFALVDFFEAEGWVTVQRLQNLVFSNQPETFLGLQAVRKGAWPELVPYRQRVSSEFLQLGLESNLQFFTTLSGSRSGKVEGPVRREIVDKVKQAARADLIETYSEGNLQTVSFYCPALPDRLDIGNKEVNLHLAFRFNEFENQTYIYLGVPIIAPDY